METDIFANSNTLLDAFKNANALTLKYHGDQTTLERAVFLSWWCGKGDCDFCYLSTQRHRIKDPSRARRRTSSILAEVEILRRIGCRLEFLSSGYGSHSIEELRRIAQMVSHVSGEGVWLNVGVLREEQLRTFGDEVVGIVASIETFNTELRKRVCPDKSLKKSLKTLKEAEKLGMKKAATIVLGLGEGKSQIPALLDFIKNINLDRITIYSLNPHRETPLSNHPPPASLYQAGVIALIRLNFPELEIIGGTWIDQLPNIGLILLAGSNGITKYPFFSMFGNRYGMKVEEEVRYANRKLLGTFSDMNILAGRKKLQRNKDPRRVLKGMKPLIPSSIIGKMEVMKDEIDDKIESYVKTVAKRKARFTQPSPGSRRSLKRCQRTRLSSYHPP